MCSSDLYALLVAASAAVYLLVNALCVSGGVVGAKPAAPKAAKKQEEPSTGNAELDKMLKDGRLAIAEMKRLDDNIADPGVSADIVRLSQVSEKIFQAVKDDPGKLPQIRKFMDYYLPTTLKLVESYEEFDRVSTPGEEIRKAKAEIENTLDTINQAFRELLNTLFQDAVFDATTDAQVLKTMLAREGLTREMEFAAVDRK